MGEAAFFRDAEAENEVEVRSALDKRLSERGAAKEMASFLGVSEAYISSVRNGHRAVPPKIAFLLGYRRRIWWEKLS